MVHIRCRRVRVPMRLALSAILALTGSALAQGLVSDLPPTTPYPGGAYGFAVALDGGTIIVGAPARFLESPGEASVFTEMAPGVWTESAVLSPPDSTDDDRFGAAIELAGDLAVIGAPGGGSGGVQSGAVYVFERVAPGVWSQVSKVTPPDGAQSDLFGVAVALSGDRLFVGASGHDVGGVADAGAVYVFGRDVGGANNWGLVTKLTAPGVTAAVAFGHALAVDDDTLLVSAVADEDNGFAAGAAYIHERDAGGPDLWGMVRKILPTDGDEFDNFGWSVALDADVAVIGAFSDEDSGFLSGSAYVHARDEGGADQWGQAQKLLGAGVGDGDRFGCAVAIDGTRMIVGAHFDDESSEDSGAAFYYERQPDGLWAHTSKFFPPAEAMDRRFGVSVRMQGTRAVLGADGFEGFDPGVTLGSARLYDLTQVFIPGDCPGDLTDDDAVNFADLNQILFLWGTDGSNGGDVDQDGDVDFVDLNVVLSSWAVDCSN